MRDIDASMVKSGEDIVESLEKEGNEAKGDIEEEQKLEEIKSKGIRNVRRNERKMRRRQRSQQSLAANGLRSNNTKPILPDHRKRISNSNLRPRTAGSIFYDVSENGTVHRVAERDERDELSLHAESRELPVYTISNHGRDFTRPKTAPSTNLLKKSVPMSSSKLTAREKNRRPDFKVKSNVYTISDNGNDFSRQDQSQPPGLEVKSWFQ
jgi:hypothetical protein